MPVDDVCLTELDNLNAVWNDAENACLLAMEASIDVLEILSEAWEHCADQLAPPPDLGDTDPDPMDVHEQEQRLEEYHAAVRDCIANDPIVIEQSDLFLDLLADCEILAGEVIAAQDEHAACMHELNDGISFP